MYKEANFFQKLLLCSALAFGSFLLFFVVSNATYIDCDISGKCKIYESNLLSKSSNYSKVLNISGLRSMDCKYERKNKYSIHYKIRNGSGSFGKYEKFTCQTIARKLSEASTQNNKSIKYKINSANFIQRFAAHAIGIFFIILAILCLFVKVEIEVENTH